MSKLKVAVLASGRGSNLKAILDSIKRGELNCEIVLVISNKRDAGAFDIAKEYDIPRLQIALEQFESQEEFDIAFLTALKKYNTDFIVLAGYLKKVSSIVIREYKNKILNIHPALLPAFGGEGMYGLRVHQAVLDYGCKVSGVTVHLVDEEYDSGPPILQRCVPVLESDTAQSLAARVLVEEHRIYADALKLFAEGRVRIEGRKVIFDKIIE